MTGRPLHLSSWYDPVGIFSECLGDHPGPWLRPDWQILTTDPIRWQKERVRMGAVSALMPIRYVGPAVRPYLGIGDPITGTYCGLAPAAASARGAPSGRYCPRSYPKLICNN